MVFAERRKGAYGVAKATMGCLSALLAAGRTDDLLALLDADDMKFWPYRRLGVEALLARGDRAAALRYAEASRTPQRYNDAAIDQACASILVASGLTEEAYQRYGLTAHTRSTNLATYRATVKAFPSIPKDRVLADLIASRPGEEGKWFAAAKSTGDLTLALRLAETSPVDIRTLLRASRDHQNAAPDFAVGTALAAMRWMCAAQFYELTGADVHGAVTLALSAATHASAWTVAEVLRRMQDLIRDDASPKQFVRMVAEGRLREIAATTTSISVTNAPD
jgi:hypothetical protein